MSSRPNRRGLPRVPGGEPWPPASERREAEPESVSVSVERTMPVVTDAETPAPHAPAEPVTGAEPAAPPATRSVRRGLPRPGAPAASAQPAPPESPVAPAAAASGIRSARRGLPRPGTPATAEAESAISAPAAPASGTRSARRGLPRPAASTAPAAPDIPPGPEPSAPAASAEARAPLTFTRTVWPGAAASGPRERRPEPRRYGPFTRGQWLGAIVVAGGGLLFAAAMAVLAVRWLLSTDALQDFLVTYPGEYHLPEGAPVGFPAWLGWQHFLNAFFILLIIRSGLQVRHEKRPAAFWTPRWNAKRKISLSLWFHQSLDILWMANGVLFVVLLFVSGQWMRIVPTSWEVFPNALSAALQYVSLDWPTENGWVNYNALQQLAYFTTVFVAAPLAIVTGVRMSGIWPKDARTLSRVYPIEWARAVHFPVMLYFVVFIVIHVLLVFATGALRNLNHMYAAQGSTDPGAYADNWTGFWFFVASLVVMAAAWIAARPLVLAPIAGLFGTVKNR